MSVAEEFRNLLLHAAELLAAAEGPARAALNEAVRHEDRKANQTNNRYAWNDAMADCRSFTAAMTYAQLVMEMTAKFLTDAAAADDAADVTP